MSKAKAKKRALLFPVSKDGLIGPRGREVETPAVLRVLPLRPPGRR